ncbi:hypothetical protein PHYBLDRAFT_174651 [Phycomyces blakesleeanus NRRL 1555(-)]|uniref:Uncharacterized protein n=1 Tax=Phycomyces blakesleeanus (strain ATCC 8743b / DSM 1359 / FGSC 10004 / NBRC 33097 / NRRL 1555) TaxID=763407 RepID=A0A167JYS1_PHYB8|nr:hypothetical protein PHYBLDRAFT_174651 [Phycomyces blakesleeanus NRRL 1555(-)]OAD66938.1 hypothetical protein PHYBLDRAFT_174651 [Phycomyces blakesleeanus NRRL 1555(-)]|eukprot:XP_018284978.1 hypothetical protein PHYBLDRAFT_174651 [Phycomyces blakesleeanus NRRL 1555(-)]
MKYHPRHCRPPRKHLIFLQHLVAVILSIYGDLQLVSLLAVVVNWHVILQTGHLNAKFLKGSGCSKKCLYIDSRTSFEHFQKLNKVKAIVSLVSTKELFNSTVKARYSDMDGEQKFYHYHYIERNFFLTQHIF